jgi:hypothetical protein
MPEDTDTRLRLQQAEHNLSVLQDEVAEIKTFILGDMKTQGLRELLVNTSVAVSTLTVTVKVLSDEVQSMHDDRIKLKGAMAAIGLICGFLGWISSWATAWIFGKPIH